MAALLGPQHAVTMQLSMELKEKRERLKSSRPLATRLQSVQSRAKHLEIQVNKLHAEYEETAQKVAAYQRQMAEITERGRALWAQKEEANREVQHLSAAMACESAEWHAVSYQEQVQQFIKTVPAAHPLATEISTAAAALVHMVGQAVAVPTLRSGAGVPAFLLLPGADELAGGTIPGEQHTAGAGGVNFRRMECGTFHTPFGGATPAAQGREHTEAPPHKRRAAVAESSSADGTGRTEEKKANEFVDEWGRNDHNMYIHEVAAGDAFESTGAAVAATPAAAAAAQQQALADEAAKLEHAVRLQAAAMVFGTAQAAGDARGAGDVPPLG